MNVSRNAYFTSEYLQDRHYRQQQNLRIPIGSDISRVPGSEVGTEVSKKQEPITPKEETLNLGPGDDLGKEITPAELNYLSTQRKSRGSPRHVVDYYDYYGSREARKRNGPLNINKNEPRSTRLFFKRHITDRELPYDANDDTFFRGDDTSLYEPSLPQQDPFSGYYIEQEKRLQSSPQFKRNTYTHKTFKDVFQTDGEERLNPIDVVFDDPNQRDLKRKQKFTRALKLVKNKLGKTDYGHYDYSRKRDHDEPVHLAVRCEFEEKECNETSSVATSEIEQNNSQVRRVQPKQTRDMSSKNEGFGDLEKALDKRSAGLKNHLRRKWKSSKPSSETDCETEFEEEKTVSDQKDSSSGNNEGDFNVTPQPEAFNSVNPFWDYVISWLAFNSLESLQDQGEGKITEIREETSTETHSLATDEEFEEIKESKPKSSGKGQKYKKLLQNWNTPTSKYIADHEQQKKSKALVKSGKLVHNTDYKEETENQEEEQFVLNSQTGQLEPMAVEGKMAGQSQMSARILHEGSPTMIVSNINKLIKNIRIMRIIFAPIDFVAENFPQVQTLVIFIELFIFMWILYELSLLIDALCMAIKAVCAPIIAIGRFMNRII